MNLDFYRPCCVCFCIFATLCLADVAGWALFGKCCRGISELFFEGIRKVGQVFKPCFVAHLNGLAVFLAN